MRADNVLQNSGRNDNRVRRDRATPAAVVESGNGSERLIDTSQRDGGSADYVTHNRQRLEGSMLMTVLQTPQGRGEEGGCLA